MEDKSPLPYQHTEFSTVFTVSIILPTLAVLPSVLLLNRSSLTRAHKPRRPYIEFRDMYKPGRNFFFFFLLNSPCNLAFYSTVNVGKHQPPQSYSVQFRRSQSCPTLCDPMNRSMPGFPVHHQLLEFIQTHVIRVSDAIQPSHPLSSLSSPAPNPSQHQSLFQ